MIFFRKKDTPPAKSVANGDLKSALTASFLTMAGPAIVATQISAVAALWLYWNLFGAFEAAVWFGAVLLVTILWFMKVRADRRKGQGAPLSAARFQALFVGLNAGVFGIGIVFAFLRSEGFAQLFAAILFIAFVSTGVFVTAMLPEVLIVWTAVLSVEGIVALILNGKANLFFSLTAYLFYLGYLGLIAWRYFRLYVERFSFQKDAEEKERELATIFDQGPLSIVVTDPEGNILQVNRKSEELSGYHKNELVGKNPRFFKSGKTPNHTYGELWETISRGGTWVGEFINRNRQGKEYAEKAVISPVVDSSGTIRKYVAIKEDVSLQREYENRITRQNEIITLLLQDFEAQSSDWMWELDSELRILYLSEKMASTLGTEPIVGTSVVDFMRSRLPPEDREAEGLLETFLAALAKREPFKEAEVKIVIQGTERWFALSAVPIAGAPEREAAWRGVGRDITDKKRLELQIYIKANFDESTGLSNRFRFKEVLDRKLTEASADDRGILGIIRLEKLDLIRANNGSSIRNSVVDAFITAFRRHFGQESNLGRLDKNEFAFWVDVDDLEQVERIQAFARALRDPFLVGSNSFSVGLNLGFACFPEDAADRSGLFRAADLALNSAINASGRNVMRYQEVLSKRFIRKLNLINEFPQSLEAGQFHMVYQAQVDAPDGKFVGAEALIRWEHPELGNISPGEFIPLAENSGFISSLGEWTLNRACRDAAAWEHSLNVSVNVSGVQLHDPRRLIRAVKRALDVSGLAAERLTLEITESAIFGGDGDIVGSLQELRKLGVSFALDDFGTGYSSLAYIRRLPLDKLKIDQSFVRSLDADSNSGRIIEIVLDLARSLNLRTVAEGVETEAQATFLRDTGCDWLQGYLFGKPMTQGIFRANALLKG